MRQHPRVVAAVLSAAVLLGLAACEKGGTTPDAKPAAAPTGAKVEYKEVAPAADYPLKTCVVSGEELGVEGKAYAIEYQGTQVQFCCKDCLDDFNKDPAKYVAMVKAARTR